MKITQIRATPVLVPLREPERWAFGERRGMASVMLELETDEGITGIGEAPGYPTAEIVLAVARSLEELVVGENPFQIERIMKRIDAIGTWFHVRQTSTAIAGVEMACWDIVGRCCGQPLVNLFGGRVRDRVASFGYLPGGTPESAAERAATLSDEGFRTLYVKVGRDDPREDVALLAAIRENAHAEARIRVDANEAWSSGAALQIIPQLEPFGLELVEQPVSGRNLEEMAYVRSRVATPILANEASWTRFDVLNVIRARAADAVSVDNQMDGGLLNLKQAAGICEVAGLPVVKHSLGELGVGTAAALHVLGSTPNFLYANQAYQTMLSDDVITEPLTPENGSLAVPEGPGIGVELDRDKVARYGELYASGKLEAGFHGTGADSATPLIPKL